jgi:multicomponent Na+:H+ antiporter subunit D
VPGSQLRNIREAPLLMLIPTWLLVAANLYFGVDTTLVAESARQGAAALLDPASVMLR